MMAVHAGGTFLVCRHLVPVLRAAGGGSIVNIASISAFVAQPGNAVYGAAKGAIVAFSRQLAVELAPQIRVNVVAPGRVRTGLTIPLYEERGGGSYNRGAALAAQNNPMGYVAEPDQLAGPTCHLLSEDASFVTGTVAVIDGGELVV